MFLWSRFRTVDLSYNLINHPVATRGRVNTTLCPKDDRPLRPVMQNTNQLMFLHVLINIKVLIKNNTNLLCKYHRMQILKF